MRRGAIRLSLSCYAFTIGVLLPGFIADKQWGAVVIAILLAFGAMLANTMIRDASLGD